MKNITLLFCFCVTLAHSQTWQWTKQNGITAPANGKAICADGNGNCYTVGDSAGIGKIIQYSSFGHPGWNISAWAGEATAIANHSGYLYVAGDSAGVVAKIGKYDYSGNQLWQINGGMGSCYGISLDNAGNIYTTGIGNVLTKYNAAGSQLWNIPSTAISKSIATDTSGNSYLTGYFEGTVSFGSYALTALGSRDIFIAKYDPAGNCLWAKRAGGSHGYCCYVNDNGNAITIDNTGNSYITGSIGDTADFDSFTLVASYDDIFVAKYDPAGNALWVKQATGNSDQEGRCITLDNNHNVLIGGSYVPNVDFSGYTMSGWGNYDAFIAEYDNNGNFITAIKAGGPDWNDYIYGICTDPSGNVFFTGSFSYTAYFGTDTLTTPGYDNSCTGKIDLETGIAEIQTDSINLNVYPNPAKNQITIEFTLTDTKQTVVEIKNVLGQTLNAIDSGFSIGRNQLEINTSQYSQGIYFIKLQSGNKRLSKKVVRE